MRATLHPDRANVDRRPSRVLYVILLAVLLLATFAVPTAASPRPITACPVCERPTAFAGGSDLTVTESTATIRVGENGSATWTASVTVANATALQRTAENGTLREGVSGAVGLLPGNPQLTGLDVSGDTFTARWRTDDFARRTGGVLLVDYLRDDPGAYVFTGLGADSVTVVGPPETEVVHAPDTARVDGRRATMTALPDGDGPFFAFGSGTFGGIRAVLSIAVLLAPAVTRNLAFLVAVPTLLFAGGTAGLRAVSRRGLGAVTPRRLALGVAGLGAALAIHPLYVAYEPLLGSPNAGLFAGAVAATAVGVTLSVADVRDGLTLGRLVAILVVSWGVGLLALAGYLALFDPPIEADLLDSAILVVPPLSLVVAGYADRRGAATAVGAFLIADVWIVDVLQVGDYMLGVAVLLAVFAAVGALLVGAPLFALGWGLNASPSR